jgi:hypothetical protein
MAQVDRKLTGSAGEHFVCSALAQLGWAASLTREGVAHADILAVHASSARRLIEVQVKTISHNRKPSWPMGANWLAAAETDHEWYVFVLLAADMRDRPRCFVVPRDHAVAGAWIAHEDWRTMPGIPAGKRNTPVVRGRMGLEVWVRYEERWDLLDESSYHAPVMLPPHYRQLLDEPRMNFPDWHPWSTHGVPDWPA